jgi:membrane protein involved in colicin uptake
MRMMLKWVGLGLLALIVLGAIFGNSDQKTEDPASTDAVIERSNDSLPEATTTSRGRAAKARSVARAKARARADARAAARARARARARAAVRRTREAERRAAHEQHAQATSAQSSRCDPNYTGACLDPQAADYDCEGGSGDGPQYTGTVAVVGSDHYDLDRDGDGTACDS